MSARRAMLMFGLAAFARRAVAGPDSPQTGVRHGSSRLDGLGIVLVVDAQKGADMREVMFFDEGGHEYYRNAHVSRRTRDSLSIGNSRVPDTIRAVWREGAGWDKVAKHWNEGTVVGDYTLPVASRIPADVIAEARAHGGSLRIKFRLQPAGVLLGWDIERNGAGTGRVFQYAMVGGDFAETDY